MTTFSVYVETATLLRRNDGLGKMTTRKMWELYRYGGEASLLVEIWGYSRGKGYAKACRNDVELMEVLQRRASGKDDLRAIETHAYRLAFGDARTNHFAVYSEEQFKSHIVTGVTVDPASALQQFAMHRDRISRSVGPTAGSKLPAKPFNELWSLPATPAQKTTDLKAALADMDIVPAAQYAEWGGFA